MTITRIAIFASGNGSNAQKIMEHFEGRTDIHVAMVISNKANAGVLSLAEQRNVPTLLINKDAFYTDKSIVQSLKDTSIDFIVLAGFLWKVPEPILKAFGGCILNIHPALLPLHGGKGMYGNRVHEAVIAAGDPISGITIHVVDEHYDNGDIVFQATCPVEASDTPEQLALKIHKLEHQHFPKVIEKYIIEKVQRSSSIS